MNKYVFSTFFKCIKGLLHRFIKLSALRVLCDLILISKHDTHKHRSAII